MVLDSVLFFSRLKLKKLSLSQDPTSQKTNFFTIIGDNIKQTPMIHAMDIERSSIVVDVQDTIELFLSFVVSRPGATWRIAVDQEKCEEEEKIESLEELEKICGRMKSRNSRQPRSARFSLKQFIRKEIDKRRSISGESRSLEIPSRRRSKLLFGSPVSKYQYPWLVSIKHNNNHICPGSIITSRHVLTSANCIKDLPLDQLSVTVHDHELDTLDDGEAEESYGIEEVLLHPQFEEKPNKPSHYDVAMVKLNQSLVFTSELIPVCWSGDHEDSSVGVYAAWGSTQFGLSSIPTEAKLPLISNIDCQV